MGSSHSLPQAQMDRLQRGRFFTKSEINRLFRRFERMGGSVVKPIPRIKAEQMVEIKHNPLRDRILDVFSTHETKQELSFDSFLDILNCFSPRCTFDKKAEWAFKLYDFNNDHFIDERDINQLLIILMGDKLEKDFRHRIVAEVLNESDLDGNKKLTRTEFNRVLKRLPEFTVKFQFSPSFE